MASVKRAPARLQADERGKEAWFTQAGGQAGGQVGREAGKQADRQVGR